MATFLTDAWASEATSACNASDEVRSALKSVGLTMQQTVTGAPGGDVAYFTRMGDGEATVALGEAPDADVFITLDYATAAEMNRGEINAQAAFMQGRLKITGNMGKLLQNQSAVNTVAPVLAALETDY